MSTAREINAETECPCDWCGVMTRVEFLSDASAFSPLTGDICPSCAQELDDELEREQRGEDCCGGAGCGRCITDDGKRWI